MPIIKRYDNNYDFKVDFLDVQGKYPSSRFFYLDYGFFVVEVYRNGSPDVVDIGHYPLHQDVNGICEWDSKQCCWKPLSSKEQEAYAAFLAEKEILRSKDAEGNKSR